MHSRLLTLDEAAAVAQVSRRTMETYVRSGRVPGTRIGGVWRLWRPTLLRAMLGPSDGEAAERAADEAAGDRREKLEPAMVGVVELARLLGLHDNTVSSMMREGTIPATKTGDRWRAYWPTIRDRIAAGAPLAPTATDPDGGPSPAAEPAAGVPDGAEAEAAGSAQAALQAPPAPPADSGT